MFHDEDVLNYVAMNGIRWNFTTAGKGVLRKIGGDGKATSEKGY